MTSFENELAKALKYHIQNKYWDLGDENSFVQMAKEISQDVKNFVKQEWKEDCKDCEDIDKEDLINLSGQVINGIMSSDNSFWTKLFDRTDHKQIANTAVSITYEMLKEINKKVL